MQQKNRDTRFCLGMDGNRKHRCFRPNRRRLIELFTRQRDDRKNCHMLRYSRRHAVEPHLIEIGR